MVDVQDRLCFAEIESGLGDLEVTHIVGEANRQIRIGLVSSARYRRYKVLLILRYARSCCKLLANPAKSFHADGNRRYLKICNPVLLRTPSRRIRFGALLLGSTNRHCSAGRCRALTYLCRNSHLGCLTISWAAKCCKPTSGPSAAPAPDRPLPVLPRHSVLATLRFVPATSESVVSGSNTLCLSPP